MQTASIPFNDSAGRLFSPLQLTLVIALHAAVWAALLASDAVAVPPRTATLFVHMIAPEPLPVAPAPVAKPQPSPPKPVTTRAPVQPPPLLATQATAPAGANAPAPEPAPVVAAAAPTAAVPAAAAAAAAAPAAQPAPLIQPRFDADYLDNPAPAYPPMSRRLGEEGKVVLRVFVEADGRPASVELKAGSGSPRLDEAALAAVRRWEFVPARRGAEPVAAWVLVPIAFHLKG
jgi:periplasmic protein TonB